MNPDSNSQNSSVHEPVINMDDYRKKIKLSQIKIFYFLVVGLLFSCVSGLGYFWYIYSESHVSTDNSYVENDIFPVNSRMMGFVKSTFPKENQFVKKGQLLAQFDDQDLMLELGFKKSKYEKAKADFVRASRLIKTNTISKMDFETATANLSAQKTDLDATLLKIEFTKILAPANGYIAKKSVQVGQFIQPGQSLYVLIPMENAWVKANFKETQVGKIKPGMKVILVADAMPRKNFFGVVESISPSSGSKLSLLPPENATGNFTKVVQRFPVIIRLDSDSAQFLRAGMSVSATVLTKDQ